MTHDPKCAEFAHDWLGPKATKSRVETLANAVQSVAEDMCEEWDEYDRDEHERAAARARGNNFEQTGGKDWT